MLNDFVFCPYSIYLHNVYMEADEDLFKAPPQTKGTIAHQGLTRKRAAPEKLTSCRCLSIVMNWASQEKLMFTNKHSAC